MTNRIAKVGESKVDALTSQLVDVVASMIGGGGVSISNTPPQNLQGESDRLTGGEDWFEVMVYLRWAPGRLAILSDALDALKESAAEGGDGWTQSLPGSRGLWKVEPVGCRLGDAARGPVMRWRFSRDGVAFGLTRRDLPHKTLPSGFVRISGDVLIAHGDARATWDLVVGWLAELGAEVMTAKVSRVDMCVDLPGVSVDEFVRAYHGDNFITRTKRQREHAKTPIVGDDLAGDDRDADPGNDGYAEVFRSGRRYTGLRLGAGTQLRIYDKLAECRDLAKRGWLAKMRWGGSVPDAATRVEFQLRRAFLTAEKCKPGEDGNLGRPVIDTVEDYFKHRAELARYLCTRWVHFFEDGFDARQPSRGVTLALWRRVIDDFQAWAGSSRLHRHKPMTRAEMPIEDLLKQAKGCIESAAARCGMVPTRADDLVYFTAENLWPLIDADADNLENKVARKMKHSIAPVAVNDDGDPWASFVRDYARV
jgi:hypothetical protein